MGIALLLFFPTIKLSMIEYTNILLLFLVDCASACKKCTVSPVNYFSVMASVTGA
jgi:hypothetical protein